MVIRDKIIDTIYLVAEITKSSIVTPLNDDTLLLQSGLDSLGLAVLVSQLEENLGYDPFAIAIEPFYPRSLGEFIEFYERTFPKK